MPEILPNEEQVLKAISKRLEQDFDCAKRLLAFGVSLPTAPRWFTTPDHVRTTLHKAALISLGCIEELNKRFRFGNAAKTQLHDIGKELQAWRFVRHP